MSGAGTGKSILITGAGSGIGRAVAELFLSEGWRVGLVGRKRETLEETATPPPGMPGWEAANALILAADVTDHRQVDAAFDALVEHWGRLDVVFNNAGIGTPLVDWDEMPVEAWKAVVDTNLSGVYYGMRAAFRIMKKQSPKGGRIINNGSISAYTPRPLSAPYTATKHAVLGLTKTGALDGRKHDIAVGQIDVGNALTEIARRISQGVLQPDGSIAPEPTIDPAHVAKAVLHMANLPPEVNVLTMNVMATKMPFVGRG
jgi:NADP-dependent 3-hydroxy acid dehydrogenase YdfG